MKRYLLDINSYFLDGNDLMLNDGPLPLDTKYDKLIAEDIQSINFTYLDEDNVDLTSPVTISSLRSVRIIITATGPSNELDRTDGKNNTRTLQTTVKCRNLGL